MNFENMWEEDCIAALEKGGWDADDVADFIVHEIDFWPEINVNTLTDVSIDAIPHEVRELIDWKRVDEQLQSYIDYYLKNLVEDEDEDEDEDEE